MAVGLSQKMSKDLDGDTPELVAWGLLDWIRRVEEIGDRDGILSAYQASLLIARESATELASGEVQGATGTHRRLAFKLIHLIAELEGRDLGQRNQGDRTWILDTYAECLEAVLGRRAAPVVAAEAVAVEAELADVAA